MNLSDSNSASPSAKSIATWHAGLGEAAMFHDVAILFVGHGTRKVSGQEQFRDLHRKFAACVAPIVSELAFLELAEPGIFESVQRIAAKSHVRRLLVVPALLFTAGHCLEDIPQAVNQAMAHHSLQLIGQTQPLECSPDVLQLSALRFRQAVCPERCLSGCSGEVCEGTSLVLVGRGSSSWEAAEKLREFCHLRQQWTPVGQATTAFIYGQPPSVPEALVRAAESDFETVVVQPHLLFPGLLLEQLSEGVNQFAKQFPNRRWIITQPLGSDLALAKLLANMALTELQSVC